MATAHTHCWFLTLAPLLLRCIGQAAIALGCGIGLTVVAWPAPRLGTTAMAADGLLPLANADAPALANADAPALANADAPALANAGASALANAGAPASANAGAPAPASLHL